MWNILNKTKALAKFRLSISFEDQHHAELNFDLLVLRIMCARYTYIINTYK